VETCCGSVPPEPTGTGAISFQSLVKSGRVRNQLAEAWPVVCITQKREEQVAGSKSIRKGGRHENQDEREGWRESCELNREIANLERVNSKQDKKAELPNQEGKESAMKTKTNVKAGTLIR
jgi:hypothetical protein